jgi:hypothetical protein
MVKYIGPADSAGTLVLEVRKIKIASMAKAGGGFVVFHE